MAPDEPNQLHRVVINQERQYSIWPAAGELPAGWSAGGFAGTRDECVSYIDRVWADLRPHSLLGAGSTRNSGPESG